MSSTGRRRSGGRPTAEAALQLETMILEKATAAFLSEGYAATTIEAIARTCGVAKRTIYARWDGKPALFGAVMERLVSRWLSATGNWQDIGELQPALMAAAQQILNVALTPEAIALHRLLIAESARFPQLPAMIQTAGAAEGTTRVVALLDRAVSEGALPQQDTQYAAEQFMHLVLAGPQRRALGLGPDLSDEQIRRWGEQAVRLFLLGAVR